MSEEMNTQDSPESTPSNENDNSAASTPDAQPTKQRDYSPYVDLSGLDESIRAPLEARFKHLSGQMKRQDEKYHNEVNQWRQVAEEQSKRIEELTSGFAGMAGHIQQQTFADNEAQLTQQMQSAFESGDMKGFLAAQEKLIDIKAEKKFIEKQPKPQPQKQQKPNNHASPENVSTLSYEDQFVVNSWQDERDTQGNLLRPWAFNTGTPENPSPAYMHALAETQAVMSNPRFANLTMEQKMTEVDRRMGVQRSSPQQSVLGNDLTGGKKSAKLTLTPKQHEIAIRTKFGGPKAKTDAEHIEAYRKQVELSRKRGS